uniref:Uncharacterized protein n=1 Tax=Arundo donax TaxID=35708 RepID=A0A0A9FLY5_ARUDO
MAPLAAEEQSCVQTGRVDASGASPPYHLGDALLVPSGFL